MKALHRPLLMICFFILCSVSVHAGQGELLDIRASGGMPAAFLQVAYGTRANGMGGIFITESGSVECAAWNPAGVAGISAPTFEVHSSIASWNRYSFLVGYGWKQPNTILEKANALIMRIFYAGNIDGYDGDGNESGAITFFGIAPEFVHAERIDFIRWGVGVKLLSELNNAYTTFGISTSAGVSLEVPVIGGIAAVTLPDIVGIIYDSGDKNIHLTYSVLRVAYAYQIPNMLSVGIGFNKQISQQGSSLMIGGEYILNPFSFRMGFEGLELSLGVSMETPRFRIDYAFNRDPILLSFNHSIGFMWRGKQRLY